MSTTTPEERAEAARMRGGVGSAGLDAEVFPAVDIKPGTQKYVLIEVSAGAAHLVRGNPRAEYHKDAAAPTVRQLQAAGVPYEILGGGRIQYDESAKTVHIYGFSYGFPWDGEPQHDVSAAVVKSTMPGVTVTTSNEGY